MEIFSNTWNLLTTENEFVTKLIVSPTVIIEAWLSLFVITTILKLHITKDQKILYIVFAAFCFEIGSIIVGIFSRE